MNINKELSSLNRRIQRLRSKKNQTTLRMKVLNQCEIEEEQDINDDYCLMVRIEENNPKFSSIL